MMPKRPQACTALVVLSLFALASPGFAGPPVSAAGARDLMRRESYPEAAAAFREYLAQNPYDGAAWGDLGYSLHALKKWDEALPAYARAIEAGARPETQMYNTACAHALLGHKDEALTWLKRSLENRFAEQRTLETDSDMDSLRADPRFIELTGLNPPAGLTSDAQWAWDLSFMVRRMEQMHWDLYGKVDRKSFADEVDRLKKEAPSLSPGLARARLSKILAMVGDGHTGLGRAAVGETTVSRVPLHLFIFQDGMHVLGAPEAHAELIGARVLKVGPLDAQTAIDATKPYLSVDNSMGYAAGAPARLVQPAYLVAIGAATSETEARYTLALRDGSTKEVAVAARDVPARGHDGVFNPALKYVQDVTGKTPLFLREADQPLWITPVPEHKLVFARFAAVADAHDLPLADFGQRIMKSMEETGAERLVIDMRFNGGGNTGLLRPLLTALIRSEPLSKPDRLFVIIGRHTFSAAQNCVNMMEDTLNVTFVGEPTGSCPAFIGESTFLVLPYSKLRVHCSSRYWQWGDSTDQRTWIAPEIAAPPTFAAYAAGRDDAMDAIVAAIAAPDGSAGSTGR